MINGNPRITYGLEVDLARDTGFSESHPLSDLTRYVLGVTAEYGLSNSQAEVAEPAELRVTLDNTGGDFYPEDPNATYYGLLTPGLLVRLNATFQGATHRLWTGRLRSVEVTPARLGPGKMTLIARDMMPDLINADYKPALQRSVTADTILTTLFNADLPAARWPYEDRPAAVSAYTEFEAGIATQAWVGDNSENAAQRGVQPRQHIAEVVAPEGGGRFFWNAAALPLGRWTFHNREHDILETIAETLVDGDFDQPDNAYLWGDRIINRVSYDHVPRKVGTPGSIVYTYPRLPLAIGKRNLNPKWTARFTDPAEPSARVGIIDFIEPVAGVDYSATDELPLGSGDRTDRLTLTVDDYADKADIDLLSSENSTIYLQVFQLKATPLYTYDRQTVTEENATSIQTYGIREQPPVLLLSVDSEIYARALAQWTIALYAEPFGRYETVSFEALKSDTRTQRALERQVGDKIRLEFAVGNHQRDYIIVGARHSIQENGISHRVRWVLAPRPLPSFFRFDDPVLSLLDNDNRLAL